MMDSTEPIYKGLKDIGIDFIVSVPCVNLSKLLNDVDEDEDIIHVPVTREEEGIGICAGAYLGGKRPAILMQIGELKVKELSVRFLWASPLLKYWKGWILSISSHPILKRHMRTFQDLGICLLKRESQLAYFWRLAIGDCQVCC